LLNSLLGVIYIRDSDGAVFLTNGNAHNPLVWLIAPNGTELFSWADPDSGGESYGSVSYRNGVVYIFNDGICTLYAVKELDSSISWQLNATDLCDDRFGDSAAHFLWEDDDSAFYFSTAFSFFKITAVGEIVWKVRGSTSFFAQAVRTIDENILFRDGRDIIKLDATSGEVLWSQLIESDSYIYTQYPAIVDKSNGNIYVVGWEGFVHGLTDAGVALWPASLIREYSTLGSPVLISSDLFLISASGKIYTVFTNNGSCVNSFANNVGPTVGSDIPVQMIWRQNVLYAYYDTGELVAFDTTDPFNLVMLWSLSLPIRTDFGGGVSIALDGTMYISSNEFSSKYPSLVSVGCPLEDGTVVAPDGLSCACPPGTDNDNACQPCAAGSVSNYSSCAQCSPNFIPNSSSSECVACPSGQISSPGDAICVAAPPGSVPGNAPTSKTSSTLVSVTVSLFTLAASLTVTSLI
jgi:hypothetical protein